MDIGLASLDDFDATRRSKVALSHFSWPSARVKSHCLGIVLCLSTSRKNGKYSPTSDFEGVLRACSVIMITSGASSCNEEL
jgi:hypothetical protein